MYLLYFRIHIKYYYPILYLYFYYSNLEYFNSVDPNHIDYALLYFIGIMSLYHLIIHTKFKYINAYFNHND